MNFFAYGGLFLPAAAAGPLLSDRLAIFVKIWFFLVNLSTVYFWFSLSWLVCFTYSLSSATCRVNALIWFRNLLEFSTNRDDSSFNYLFSSSISFIWFLSSVSTFEGAVAGFFLSNSCYSSAICFHWVRDWLYLSIYFYILSICSYIFDTFFFWTIFTTFIFYISSSFDQSSSITLWYFSR